MKALQLTAPRCFVETEIPIPVISTIGTEKILVKSQWVSICGSDIPFFSGRKRCQPYPLPTGAPVHECTGIVVESTSLHFNPGDLVLAIPDGNQGLAEYFIAQPTRAFTLPSDILNDRGTSCLIQPLATVLNAIDRLQNIHEQVIAVVGLGSIGQLFCWVLRQRGAAEIIGIDPIQSRCNAAMRMGATSVYPITSNELVHLNRSNPGKGISPDVCIEAVGHQMDTLNDCFDLINKYGTVLAFGVPDHPIYSIEYEIFFRKNAQLIAAVTPDWRTYFAQACDEFRLGRDELGKLFTHWFPIQNAGAAFTQYENHQDGILKALLDSRGWS